MKNDLFRQEVVDKIRGPEDLNTYVKVLNPKVWLVLVSIAIAVIGLVVFVSASGFPVAQMFLGTT